MPRSPNEISLPTTSDIVEDHSPNIVLVIDYLSMFGILFFLASLLFEVPASSSVLLIFSISLLFTSGYYTYLCLTYDAPVGESLKILWKEAKINSAFVGITVLNLWFVVLDVSFVTYTLIEAVFMFAIGLSLLTHKLAHFAIVRVEGIPSETEETGTQKKNLSAEEIDNMSDEELRNL